MRRFSKRKSFDKFRKFANSSGTVPSSWFASNSSHCSNLQLLISGGIGPDREFCESKRYVRLLNKPREVGILPDRLLLTNSSY